MVLFNDYKTKKISLNEFIISAINSLFEECKPNFKKPSFEGSIVPTWYNCESAYDYKIKLIQWFLKTIVFPDNYIWNNSEKMTLKKFIDMFLRNSRQFITVIRECGDYYCFPTNHAWSKSQLPDNIPITRYFDKMIDNIAI